MCGITPQLLLGVAGYRTELGDHRRACGFLQEGHDAIVRPMVLRAAEHAFVREVQAIAIGVS